MAIEVPTALEEWNARGADYLPGHLGMTFEAVESTEVRARFTIEKHHMAWNGFLHAAAIVALADTCCGYGVVRSLPDGASGFTTVDLTSNFLATAREGEAVCTAVPLHQGRTTQVWDAKIVSSLSDRVMAHFRCTQLILWPK
jgi:uncharacterized protein (TIGR00369 family)